MKRGRNRGRNTNNKPHYSNNNVNRTLESNGPDVKIRGNAQHIYEKYQQLARDANASGDRVMAESYLQHAEHYFRVLLESQPQGQQGPYNQGQTQSQPNQNPPNQGQPIQGQSNQHQSQHNGGQGQSQDGNGRFQNPNQQNNQNQNQQPFSQQQPTGPADQSSGFQGLPGPAFVGEETEDGETDDSSEIRP